MLEHVKLAIILFIIGMEIPHQERIIIIMEKNRKVYIIMYIVIVVIALIVGKYMGVGLEW